MLFRSCAILTLLCRHWIQTQAGSLDGGANSNALIIMRALEYISSAGLRIILRLLKREPQLSLQELSSEVYEIFDMTGFTEMMPIRKAYRQVSIDGCELIGRGANGTVYRLDRDTVVKVYNAPDCLPDVQRERELARKAFVLGIPTAIPYDVVRVGSKFGSVFELLDAQSLSKLIAAHTERYDEYVKTYVDLMRRLHSTPVKPGDMPNVKGLAQECVDHACQLLSPGQSAKLRALVSAVPDTGTMLHAKRRSADNRHGYAVHRPSDLRIGVGISGMRGLWRIGSSRR